MEGSEASAATDGRACVPLDFPHPIVLGIDPGTAVVGYGAVVRSGPRPRLLACGVLRMPRGHSVPQRLGRLRGELDDLIRRLRPSVVVVERAFAAKNVQSALRIGEGRGVALACAGAAGIEVVEIAPASAKKAVVGHGAADKQQVAQMIVAELGQAASGLPLDATDALALALCFVYKQGLTAGR